MRRLHLCRFLTICPYQVVLRSSRQYKPWPSLSLVFSVYTYADPMPFVDYCAAVSLNGATVYDRGCFGTRLDRRRGPASFFNSSKSSTVIPFRIYKSTDKFQVNHDMLYFLHTVKHELTWYALITTMGTWINLTSRSSN